MASKKNKRERTEPSLFGLGGGAPAKPAKKKKRKSKKRARAASGGGLMRALRFVFYWGMVAAVWGAIAVVGIVIYYGSKLPPVDEWAVPDRAPQRRHLDKIQSIRSLTPIVARFFAARRTAGLSERRKRHPGR